MSNSSSMGCLYATSLSSCYIHEFSLPSEKTFNDLTREIIDYETNQEKSDLIARHSSQGSESSDIIISRQMKPFKPLKLASSTMSLQVNASRRWLAHEASIWQCLYIPSRKSLVTCSRDSLIKEWIPGKTTTSEELKISVPEKSMEEPIGAPLALDRKYPRLQKHWITCVEHIRPEHGAEFLVSGSDDKSIQIFNLQDLSRPFDSLIEWKCKSGVYALKSIDRGRKLVAGTHRGECYLFDVTKGAQLLKWKAHEAQVNSMEFIKNTLFTSAQFDEKISMWDLRVQSECKPIGQLSGHTAPVWTLKQHQGQLYSAGADGSICKWQWSQRQYVDKFLDMHEKSVIYSLESLGDHFMASAGEDKTVRVFEPKNGLQLAKLNVDHCVHSIQFVPSHKNES